jgi:hypothetical protein
MDTPAGPAREMAAEATNQGGVDSGVVTVLAQIDGADVGRFQPLLQLGEKTGAIVVARRAGIDEDEIAHVTGLTVPMIRAVLRTPS